LPEIEAVTRSIRNAPSAQSLNTNQDNCRYLGTTVARELNKTFNLGSYLISKQHNFSAWSIFSCWGRIRTAEVIVMPPVFGGVGTQELFA